MRKVFILKLLHSFFKQLQFLGDDVLECGCSVVPVIAFEMELDVGELFAEVNFKEEIL